MREIKFRAWINGEMETSPRIPFPNSESNIPVNDLFDLRSRMYGKPINWMRYTGFKDKNGKEIYEGDIVKQLGNDWGEIFEVPQIDFLDGWTKLSLSEPFEVIGNIYENPNLLKTA